MKSSFNWHCAR